MKKNLDNSIKKAIRTIPDFPKSGIMFRDITSLIEKPLLFKKVVNKISGLARKKKITKIIGIESRGFIFAAPVAAKLELPLILIRKSGKLPGKVFKVKYNLEYGNDALEINKTSLNKKDNVMVIDDLIATGGTAIASSKLISKINKKRIEYVFLVHLQDLPGLEKIIKLGHNVTSFCKFREEEK